VFPVGSNHIDAAIETVRTFHDLVLTKIGEKGLAQTIPDCGCVRVTSTSIDDILRVRFYQEPFAAIFSIELFYFFFQ
jgi:hypothetical protein